MLFIPAWYPSPENPLAGNFVREHARAAALYDDVTVLYVRAAGGDARPFAWREELDDGVRTIRVTVPKIPAINTPAVVASFERLLLQGYRPDIIHAHVYHAGVPAALLSKLHRTPLVVTEHWTGFPRRILSRKQVVKARFAFGLADVVLPVSDSLKCAIQAYGIKANFEVVPNAIDIDLFHPGESGDRNSGPKRLLFVGILDGSHKKGVHHLLRALGHLRRRRADWHLDIVGDGPARPQYERLAVEIGIDDAVTFKGPKAKREVADYMQSADLFVLPSLWENLPVVLIEAMASGLPIVSTLTGGIPEIVDEQTGKLVPPGDESALSEALGQMLDSLDTYDREQIALKARRYSHSSVGRSLHAIYSNRLAE